MSLNRKIYGYFPVKSAVSPYQRFFEALKTDATRENYPAWWNKFCDYCKLDSDKLATLESKKFADLAFQYIVHLKRKVDKGELKSNSIRPMIAPIKLFCVQNDIMINWKKLTNILPSTVPPANQGAYTDEDIRKLLEHTTSFRNKAIIHFLASTGSRIGALTELNYGDIVPIEDGALVWIYNDANERYRGFLTPEAYGALKDYLEFRENESPQIIKEDSPVFCKRNHIDRLKHGGVRRILPAIMKTAGLRQGRAEKKKDSKSPNHAFRKRYENILLQSDIPTAYVATLQGSIERMRDKHYVKNTVSTEKLWHYFKKAVPELTIDKTQKMSISHELEKQELTENFQTEYKEKIESLEDQLSTMNHMLASRIYLFYERLHGNDVNKMKKKMGEDEIDEWNWAIRHPKINRPELTINLTQSERTMKQIKGIRDWKQLVKDLKKKGVSKEQIDDLVKQGKEIARDMNLPYDSLEQN